MKKGNEITTEKKLSERQIFIAQSRYLKHDKKGKVAETVQAMFQRISRYIASAEKNYKTAGKEIKKLENDFFTMQSQFEFLSGFTLSDQGRQKLMAACYVLPLHDSLESIYETLYKSVQLHRLGAGIGYDFSEIRPEGAFIHTTGKQASGPISFMRLYDFSSEVILNRGSTRHAGHMGILRIDHPDVMKFIHAKDDHTQLTNFNISVAITDDFMKVYENDGDFYLKNPQDGSKGDKVRARKLLHEIASCSYKTGEPGIIFIDEINRKNLIQKAGTIAATNLCGEQPLLPYESCTLGSLVLPNFIIQNETLSFKNRINWKRLEEVIRLSVRFLDNTLDLQYYPLPELKKTVVDGNRKIGLGIMGWADLLAELSLPYDSEKALELAESLMKFIQDTARSESASLGKKKGNFGNFHKSIYKQLGFKTMRNGTLITIAPTGTISLFADCNSGIEPFFALSYIRENMETLGNKKLMYVNKVLEKKLKQNWLFSEALMDTVVKEGSIQNIDEIPLSLKKVFKTAYEIKPEWHLKMQSAFQKFTDNAVSKTINLPENTSVNTIQNIYKEAYHQHLKGVTIYRNKSREKQVLTIHSK
jgi:ribonucleoside-diphosphate reductase alpha chain